MWQRFERWLISDRPWWHNQLYAAGLTLLVVSLPRLIGVAPGFPLSVLLLFAVVVCAVIGGFSAGLLSTALALYLGIPQMAALRSRTFPGVNWTLIAWAISFVVLSMILCLLLEALHRASRRRAAAQQMYVSTLANVSDSIITTDHLGRIEYMNQAAMLLLQCDLKEVAGRLFEEVIDIRDEVTGGKSAVLGDHARFAFSTVHSGKSDVLRRPDGQMVPVASAAVPVRTSSGELLNVVISIRDNSEQRQSEREMQERIDLQSRLEHIAEVVPGAVYEYRMPLHGRRQLTFASHSFKEIFGLDPETLRDDANKLGEIVHRDDRQRLREAVEHAGRTMQVMDIEYRVDTPHRGQRWVALAAAPSPESDGGTLWHGVFTDVTERKLAEERLRGSELQLRAALEAGDMGVLRIDLTTQTVQMDAAGRRLWGLESMDPARLTMDSLLSTIESGSVASVREEFRQLNESHPSRGNPIMHACEYRLKTGEDTDRWLLCRGRVYRDESTDHIVKVGVVIDITGQRRTEEQRLNSQKLESLGVLAGGIAHDFNNMLLAISGNARLLLDDMSMDDSLRTSVKEIDKAAERATELVRRILAFSRQNEPSSGPQATALRPVLNEVLGLVRAVLPATVTIRSEIPDVLPAVSADDGQIHQVLINLLTNAADAAVEADGVVRIVADVISVDTPPKRDEPGMRPGKYVRIAVSDAGKGISRDLQQRIFDPFFTTKPKGKGTGLGLATVHGIMMRIHGAVTVESELGHGATFTVLFPVRDEVISGHRIDGRTPSAGREARILYVDDEEILVLLMTRTLMRAGHHVTAFTEPQQALATFSNDIHAFDLVVSDMTMPGMSGLDLAEQVLTLNPAVPFVITTGYVDADQVTHAQALGVRRVIMKPNSVDELSEVLEEILKRTEGAPA